MTMQIHWGNTAGYFSDYLRTLDLRTRPNVPIIKSSTMDTSYLDQLARHLKADKSPACRRAINRILADVKKRCEKDEYLDPTEAESAFRELVENERSCQKAKAV